MSRVFTSIRRAVVVGMFLASMSSTARAESLHIDHRTLDPLPSELLRRMSVPVGLDQRGEPWSMVDRAASCLELDFSASTFSLAAFQEEKPADAPEEPAERLNRIGLFLGATTTTSGHTGVTIGLEYERRLSDLIGIGAVLEGTPGGREVVGAVPVFFHPVGGLALSIGPGFSVEEGHAAFLVRFGAGWAFELREGLSLALAVSYDLTEGTHDAIVYGVMLSYAF